MRWDGAGEDVDGDWPPPDEMIVGDDDGDDFPLPEGEIIVIIITNNSPILGRAISINILNNTISSQTLVHLLCSILLPEL